MASPHCPMTNRRWECFWIWGGYPKTRRREGLTMSKEKTGILTAADVFIFYAFKKNVNLGQSFNDKFIVQCTERNNTLFNPFMSKTEELYELVY